MYFVRCSHSCIVAVVVALCRSLLRSSGLFVRPPVVKSIASVFCHTLFQSEGRRAAVTSATLIIAHQSGGRDFCRSHRLSSLHRRPRRFATLCFLQFE